MPETTATMSRDAPLATWRSSAGRFAALLGIVLLVAWAWAGTGFDPARLGAGLPRLGEFLARMAPPDLTIAGVVFRAMLETVQIALLGTVFGAGLAIGLGLLAAANLTPGYIHQPVKWILGAIRGVPVILLALMFVSAYGLGPLPGVAAIALHSSGMLGKFYAEAFEAARPGPIEALRTTGAAWPQIVRFAVLPQIAPELARDTLFRFELNLRESLVLGLVGAGGIGFYIQLYARAFHYEKVATLTLVVLAMVVLVEQASVLARRRLS